MRLASGNELSSVTLTSRRMGAPSQMSRSSVGSVGLLSSSYQSGALRTVWMFDSATPPTCGLSPAGEAVVGRRTCERCGDPGVDRRPACATRELQSPPPASAPASAFVCRCFAWTNQLPMPITTPTGEDHRQHEREETTTWPPLSVALRLAQGHAVRTPEVSHGLVVLDPHRRLACRSIVRSFMIARNSVRRVDLDLDRRTDGPAVGSPRRRRIADRECDRVSRPW